MINLNITNTILILLPIIIYLFGILLIKAFAAERKEKVLRKILIEITSIFLVIAVQFQLKLLLPQPLAWVVWLVPIFFANLFAIYQYQVRNEIKIWRIARLALRLTFIFLLLVYVGLVIWAGIDVVLGEGPIGILVKNS